MKQIHGLSRQIVMAMTLLVLSVTVAITVGSYVFYYVMFSYAPDHLADPGNWMPSGPEWLWIVLSTLCGLVLAVMAAIKLSRRILKPLTSVASSLRLVSQGDLTARAVSDDRSLGEASLLVEDFNTMAERLERMEKEQMFWNAAIAHELRTPITVLRGRMQGLAEGVFEPSEPLFRNLLGQVEHLGRLIEDLRVVGLADSGHLSLQMAECALAAEVHDVVGLMEPDLQARGFTVETRLDAVPVRCDAVRMRQALLALLENARCHAIPGALVVTLTRDDGTCRLAVTDSGPGIDADLAGQIFDAFQRGDAARERSGGSGLGLAVVRAIALAHGGQAICRPASGAGTTFELLWPVQ